jgi:hypothetical protein
MGGCAFCVAEDGAGGEKATLSPADFPAAAPWWRRARGGQASSTDRRPRPGCKGAPASDAVVVGAAAAAAAAALVWVGTERDRGFGSA